MEKVFEYANFDDELLKKEAYDYMLSNCDKVEFFSELKHGGIGELKDIRDIKFPQLEECLLSVRQDSSWGVDGSIFTFKLNNYMKEIIYNNGLTNFLYLDEDNKFFFQNITLLKGNDVMYTCCTHESFDEFEEEFRLGLTEVCREKLQQCDIYNILLSKLKLLTLQEIDDDLVMLRDLVNYINKDIGATIFVMPNNDDITFTNYIDIANKYLSDDCIAGLRDFHSYSELVDDKFELHKEVREKIVTNSVSLLGGVKGIVSAVYRQLDYIDAIVNYELIVQD